MIRAQLQGAHNMSEKPVPKMTPEEWFRDCHDYLLLPKTPGPGLHMKDYEATARLRGLAHDVLWYRAYMAFGGVKPGGLPNAESSYAEARIKLADFIADNLLSHNIHASTLEATQ